MAANNNNNNNNNGGGGRQGNNNQMNEHVEFSVKAEEDLYLTGSESTIRRVAAETNYSCLMLKTQRFSSLFRHYAKYHGLRKDELEYYFVNLLENEDTPESVHLQRGDTIMVRKKRKPPPPELAADDDEYFKDLRDLLGDEEHMDCLFVIRRDGSGDAAGPDDVDNGHHHLDMEDEDEVEEVDVRGRSYAKRGAAPAPASAAAAATMKLRAADPSSHDDDEEGVRAHKAILTARGEYFRALFRKSHFLEATTCVVAVDPTFTYSHLRHVLEFLYTNRIQDIGNLATDDLLSLLHLSDKWMLRDLKRIVEHELIHHMSLDTVARMYGATEDFHAQRLARACVEFIMANLRQLAGNPAFEEDMKNYPLLCIPVLKAAAEIIPDGPPHKKQRIDVHTPSSAGSQLGSSPVPDSDA